MKKFAGPMRRFSRGVCVAVSCALLGGARPAPAEVATSGISVAWTTASTAVALGSEFDVELVVTEAGSPFNAFEAIVGYDPSALTLLPLSPLSLQEGSLVTAACAMRFHRFRVGADRDTITESLLCNQVSLTGPGQIYRLRFRASNTPQTTTIAFLPGLRFYDAGVAVTPVQANDLTLSLEGSVSVADPVAGQRLRVGPNPASSEATIWVESRQAGRRRILVRDLAGREVRTLRTGWTAAGSEYVRWDGRDEAGASVPSGIYFVELNSGADVVRSKVALTR
jgi:hypothetical protein